jgi:hypothetical protein
MEVRRMVTLKLRAFVPAQLEPEIVSLDVNDLIVAGWTGRDSDAVERHIEELEAIGVKRPKQTPMFYRVAADRLTFEDTVDVIGKDSTGEVEFVLLRGASGVFVGLGSDHTDRKAEAHGVTLSKQICPKPIAPEVWRWTDVEPHWDKLRLRCVARTGGIEILYQDGPVTALLHPSQLMDRLETANREKFAPGAAMFCGTLVATNRISWADHYELELIDPILMRKLQHRYSVRSLPVAEA